MNKNNEPILSIIVPVYNGKKFLFFTLKSLLNLDKKINMEIIFQDAKSSDGSIELINKFLNNFKNARLYIEKDAGQSDAINKGVLKASGKYITWLCADDLLLDKFAEMIHKLKNNNIDIIYGDCVVSVNNSIVPAIGTEDFVKKKLLKKRLFIQQPGTCIKKTKWDNVGGLNINLNWIMDYDLFIRLENIDCTFYRFKEFVSVARVHSEAKTSSGSFSRFLEHFYMFLKHQLKNLNDFSLRPFLIYFFEYLIKVFEYYKIHPRILSFMHNLFWKIAQPKEIDDINNRFNENENFLVGEIRFLESIK